MSEIPERTVEELRDAIASGAEIEILDVREEEERKVCRIEGSTHLPLSRLGTRLDEVPRYREAVVVCHHGSRSAMVVARLRSLGYDRLFNLRGGIDAWARRIDPSMERY